MARYLCLAAALTLARAVTTIPRPAPPTCGSALRDQPDQRHRESRRTGRCRRHVSASGNGRRVPRQIARGAPIRASSGGPTLCPATPAIASARGPRTTRSCSWSPTPSPSSTPGRATRRSSSTSAARRVNGQWTGFPAPFEHDILTGSNADGTVAAGLTCSDWTSDSAAVGSVGHSVGSARTRARPAPSLVELRTHHADLQQPGPSWRGRPLYCFAR